MTDLYNVATYSLNSDSTLYVGRAEAMLAAKVGDRLHTNVNGYTVASEPVEACVLCGETDDTNTFERVSWEGSNVRACYPCCVSLEVV